MKIQLQGDSRDTSIRRADTSFPCCTHVGCGEHLASLRAELAKLRAEIAQLRSIKITVDTPYEVCDGTVHDTIENIVKQYGQEALGWVSNDKHREIAQLHSDIAVLKSEIEVAIKLLRSHTDEAACEADKCGCVVDTLPELIAGILEENAVLANEVTIARPHYPIDETRPEHLAGGGEYKRPLRMAMEATDAAGALERNGG